VSGSVQAANPGLYYVNYYAGYAQDDLRLNDKLTLNFGMRYELESGLREQNDHLVVGFDPTATFPVQVGGLNLKGGLMYAGQNGYPTYQGNPVKNQIAPRGGFAWSLDDLTVVRGGWGLFWAPTQFPATTEAALGARGYSASTSYLASTDGNLTPAGKLSNPFPAGITQPQGNSLGLLTGAGGVVDFPDQDSKTGYVQQYSSTSSVSSPAATSSASAWEPSERLSMGGTSDATVNINQLDPQFFSRGTQLQAQVPNPFFGNAVFGNLSRSATIAAGQLLRPFPQFDNVLAHRTNSARARYNALVMRWDKRLQHGWGINTNYTYSRLNDNQFGEANFYAARLGQALDNYNLQGEYGPSLADVPHRLNASATFELPFGAGRRWLSSNRGVAGAVLGGWSVSVAGRYSSGFPLNITQSSNNSGLLGSTQRPNLVPGASAVNSGSATDNYNAACNCIQWLNPAAWTAASAFTFGNTPRTDAGVRTPGQAETDLNIQKLQRLGKMALTLRVDLLNMFNDPLFIGPVSTFGVGNFGQINTLGGFARSLQLHIRLGW
jgi:hypothetical protein